jgi:AraC-like DNA-binding protein
MDTIDTALRLMVIGQIVLISMVLAARGPRAVSIPMVLLQASVAAYLVKSSPVLAANLAIAEIPLYVLAMASPFLVWVCANVLFDFERPPKWVMVVFPSVTLALCSFKIVDVDAPLIFQVLSIVASLIAILHAIYSVVSGSLDDLSEPRRRFRLCFVACVSLAAAFVLVMELAYVGKPVPSWLPLTNVSLIAAVFLVISLPLITRPADLLPDDPPPPDGSKNRLDAADVETHGALVRAMENRAYARTGLSIRQLAEELKIPEHRLRALINSQLGYKNFSTFLNGYRINEACDRLRDPKEARIPVLTIALDAGFASIAPFNRAFRQSVGMTPTEYRRQKLQAGSVVTAIRG